MRKFIIQPHVRLQEWVAEENGYFTEEGLDYEFQVNTTFGGETRANIGAATESPSESRSGALEDMVKTGRSCDVSSACHWAVNQAVTVTDAHMYGKAYSVAPAGIFVAPDSSITHPEDLAGVPVSVAYHSGSHFSAIQALEPFVDGKDINLSFTGAPWDRVRQTMKGKVAAANVFGAQYYVLEQLGFRKVVDTTLMIGSHIPAGTNLEDVTKYFRALEKAQRAIDLTPERYKKHWAHQLPKDIATLVDIRRFGPGERLVFLPYTRDMYQTTQEWMKSRDLFDSDLDAQTLDYKEAVLI